MHATRGTMPRDNTMPSLFNPRFPRPIPFYSFSGVLATRSVATANNELDRCCTREVKRATGYKGPLWKSVNLCRTVAACHLHFGRCFFVLWSAPMVLLIYWKLGNMPRVNYTRRVNDSSALANRLDRPGKQTFAIGSRKLRIVPFWSQSTRGGQSCKSASFDCDRKFIYSFPITFFYM